MKYINDIIEYLSTIQNICNGGCGIMTYVLYILAKERYPDKDIQIIYSYFYKHEVEHNKPIIESNDLSGVHTPWHCYITIDGQRFDVSDNTEWDYNTIPVSFEFLVHSIIKSSWNHRFDRSFDHLSKIELHTGVELTKFAQ